MLLEGETLRVSRMGILRGYETELPRVSEVELLRASRMALLRNGVPRNFVQGRGGGGSTNSVEDRGQRTWIWGR
jgi:hypothetical protein